MLLKNTTWFAAFFLMMAIMSNCYAINTTGRWRLRLQ